MSDSRKDRRNPDGLLERWTDLMLRWRWLVLLVWVGAFAAAMLAVPKLPDLLTNRFVLPGTETERVQEVLKESFNQDPEGTFMLLAESDGSRPVQELAPALQQSAEQAAAQIPGAAVAGVQPLGERLLAAQINTPLELAEAKVYTEDLRERAPPVPGATLYLTGSPALEHDLDDVFAEDLKVGELFIALPVALLILVFTFGTLSLLLPFLFAAAAITITLGIVYLVAQQLTLSSYIQNLVTLIGLGIAIDYSLIILARYREERRRTGKRAAIIKSMGTAGRAVVFSGTAVGIGLALMLIMPLPFMQGFGIAGLIIPTVSVLCAITLLPVLMYFLTDPFEKVRLVPKRVLERRQDDRHSFWGRLARLIMRRPATFFVTTTLLLVVLAAPLLAFKPAGGSYDPGTLPEGIESVDGFTLLTNAAGDGALGGAIVLVDGGEPTGARQDDVQQALRRLATAMRADPEVANVVAEPVPGLVDATGRYQQVIVTGAHGASEEPSRDFIERLRSDLIPAADFPEGVDVLVGGEAGASVDFLDLTYSGFPYLIAGILFLTFFLLMRAFRSVVLPLKAIVLNLLAIGAAYGVMVALFQWGWGEPLGLISAPIEGWVPVFMFAMLFGLSMDYEVFLVSRMREEWDARHDNEHAVWLGLAKTGRLVTAAGLIMVAAFMGFVAGSLPGLQQFGLGLALAIFIDVTVIRGLLLPSTMKLLGRWNWYLPARAARWLRIKDSA